MQKAINRAFKSYKKETDVQKSDTRKHQTTMTHILVIDDDPEITSLLKTALSNDTTHVQTAHDGRAGLRLLREYRFDLVITDIIMPKTDGIEVIMEINSMRPRPRVIAMTGGTDRISRDYLTNLVEVMNVQGVLNKPFSINELLITVFPHRGGI